MRIVIAAACDFPDGFGAAPRMLWLMARGFSHVGHEVITATTYGTWDGPREKDFGEWTSICGSTIAGDVNGVARRGLLHRLRNHIVFLCILLKLLFGRRPDVVLFSGPLMLYPVVNLVARMFTRCRTCYYYADGFPSFKGMSPQQRVKFSMLRIVEWILSRYGSVILIVGTSQLERHLRGLAPKTPIIRGRGVPTDITAFSSGDGSRFRETYKIPWKQFVFFGGVISSLEGNDILLRAFRELRAKRPDVGLVVAGSVAQTDPVRGTPLDYAAIVAELGIGDAVRFTGHIPKEHIYDALAAADVLVMPKIDHVLNQVAFPIKIAEYLASGRPVVASRVCEIDQYAKDGQDLLFVTPGDEEGLTKAIGRVLDDPALAESLGLHGRQLAQEVFDYRNWFAHVAPAVFGSKE